MGPKDGCLVSPFLWYLNLHIQYRRRLDLFHDSMLPNQWFSSLIKLQNHLEDLQSIDCWVQFLSVSDLIDLGWS